MVMFLHTHVVFDTTITLYTTLAFLFLKNIATVEIYSNVAILKNCGF